MTAPSGGPKINIIGIVAGVGGAIAGALAVQYFMGGGGKTDRQQIDQSMMANRTGAIIKREFPQDYEDILNRMSALAADKSLTDDQRTMKATQLTANVRVKYASFAGQASEDALRRVVQTQIATFHAAKDKLGDEVCIDLINNGPARLLASGQMSKLMVQVDDAAEAMMSAMADGHRHAVKRREPTDQDLEALGQAVIARGFTEEQFASASDGVANAGDCDGTIAIFEAASALTGETGDIMRAFMVGNIAASQ